MEYCPESEKQCLPAQHRKLESPKSNHRESGTICAPQTRSGDDAGRGMKGPVKFISGR